MLQRCLALAVLLSAGCTRAALTELPPPPPPSVDDALSIEGEVCTLSPEDLVFPLRVIFLVDASESMEVNDPPDPGTGETGRERAVRETVEDLLEGGGDVEVSLVRFSSEAQPLTAEYEDDGTFAGYFTSDLDYVRQQLPYLAETDRTTNYINALAEAYSEIRDELTRADQESLSLSAYHVILISDGIPDAEGGETIENSTDNILGAIDAILDLGAVFHIEEVVVDTALIATGNAEVDAAADALLGQMAAAGSGTYRSFASGGELNFLDVDLTALRRVFTLRTLVAFNLNTVFSGGRLVADSDGDGLADVDEEAWGTDPTVADTDGDGCRDSSEVNAAGVGLDPNDPTDCDCLVADYCFDADEDGACDNGCVDADVDGLCDCIDADADGICDPENYPDTDGDGIHDCEERYSGTNRNGADTDGDGLIDNQELRFGTSPDIDDVADDADWDAVPNGEEVRSATDPLYADEGGRYDGAYRYDVAQSLTTAPGSTCYSFEIENVTLAEVAADGRPSSGPGGQGWSGWNRVLLYAGEVPFDDHESYARFRVACVEARFVADGNYRNPPSGHMDVAEERFVDLADFDPDVDCFTPGGGQ